MCLSFFFSGLQTCNLLFFLHLDLLFGFLLNVENSMGLGGSIWIGGIRSCRLILSLWMLKPVNEKCLLWSILLVLERISKNEDIKCHSVL